MVAVAGMEYSKSSVCLYQLQNSKCSRVNRRKLCNFMHAADREFANRLIASEAPQESVCNKVNLEFTVRVSAHQITHTDDLCVKSAGNSFQYRSFCQELGTDIFIGNTLSDIQVVFTEDSVLWRNTL